MAASAVYLAEVASVDAAGSRNGDRNVDECEELMRRGFVRESMSDEQVPMLAEHFRALSEPARLCLLRVLLAGGEQPVNALVQQTGLQQANVSKHLQVLHTFGFVRRRKVGLFVYYALADRDVAKLLQLMSTRLPDPSD